MDASLKHWPFGASDPGLDLEIKFFEMYIGKRDNNIYITSISASYGSSEFMV